MQDVTILFCRTKNRTGAHYYAKSYHSRFEFVVCCLKVFRLVPALHFTLPATADVTVFCVYR